MYIRLKQYTMDFLRLSIIFFQKKKKKKKNHVLSRSWDSIFTKVDFTEWWQKNLQIHTLGFLTFEKIGHSPILRHESKSILKWAYGLMK